MKMRMLSRTVDVAMGAMLLLATGQGTAFAFVASPPILVAPFPAPALPSVLSSSQHLSWLHTRSLTPLGLSATHEDASTVDRNTAPLSKLVPLKENEYHLVSPLEDVLELKEGQRLVCIGDVHGDLKALEEFLTIAEVYQPNQKSGDLSTAAAAAAPKWTGGDTILVQCGDVLDRGNQELPCWQLLTQLSQQAAEQGGHVIVLWGNHEALNAGAQFHYTAGEEEYERIIGARIDQALSSSSLQWRTQFGNHQPARWATYEPGNGILATPLLANLKVAVKVGRTLCVHAGLTSQHLEQYGGIRGMNEQAREWVKKGKQDNSLSLFAISFSCYENAYLTIAIYWCSQCTTVLTTTVDHSNLRSHLSIV